MLLREWIWRTGKTYDKMSKELKINQGYLHGIGNGRHHPSRRMAVRISEYTKGDVSAEEIMFPENQPDWQRLKDTDYRVERSKV